MCMCLSAGVPLEPSAQRSAGRCEGSVQGGETLGGAADRHRTETQAPRGQETGTSSDPCFTAHQHTYSLKMSFQIQGLLEENSIMLTFEVENVINSNTN